LAKAVKIPSTQKYLNILTVRDGLAVMKDGGLRLVLKVSSINFALKSEEEQNALIGQYQGFLNGLKFQMQVVMQSRRIDLYNYLRYLREEMQKQTNDMIRLHMEDYIGYIERLIAKANIMDKKFFVVVPYFPSGIQKTTIIDKILGAAKSGEIHYTTEQFKKYQQELKERADLIIGGLGALGLRVETLNTQEVVELLYSIYNPEEALNERMTQVNDLGATVISSDTMGIQKEPLENEKKPEAGKAAEASSGADNTKPGLAAPAEGDVIKEEELKNTIENIAPVGEQTPLGDAVSVNGQNFYATPQVLQTEVATTEAPLPTAQAVTPEDLGQAQNSGEQIQNNK
jgi:hypothetical protein